VNRLLYNNIHALLQRRLSRSLIRHNIPNHINNTERPRIQRRRTTLDDMDGINERGIDQDTEVLFGREGRDMSVTVIGALLWPTISSIVGRYICIYIKVFKKIETGTDEVILVI
jgi:hypothetical protein